MGSEQVCGLMRGALICRNAYVGGIIAQSVQIYTLTIFRSSAEILRREATISLSLENSRKFLEMGFEPGPIGFTLRQMCSDSLRDFEHEKHGKRCEKNTSCHPSVLLPT